MKGAVSRSAAKDRTPTSPKLRCQSIATATLSLKAVTPRAAQGNTGYKSLFDFSRHKQFFMKNNR